MLINIVSTNAESDRSLVARWFGSLGRYLRGMNLSIECEEEIDGRWLAEVLQLPGVMCYGRSADEAMARAEILALRTLAERLEHSGSRPVQINISLPLAMSKSRLGRRRRPNSRTGECWASCVGPTYGVSDNVY